MRMQQLPIFHTMYADRDGHIMYVYNAAPPVRTHGDHRYWSGVMPGDRVGSDRRPTRIVPFDQLPQVIDPPTGWVQNCNDSPWTSTYPMPMDPAKFAAYMAPPPAWTQRSQRSIRLLSESGKITLADLKAMKLSTRSEIADHFVDDLVAAARQRARRRRRKRPRSSPRGIVRARATSDGTLLFLRFMQARRQQFPEHRRIRRAAGSPAAADDAARICRSGEGRRTARARSTPARRRIRHDARDLGRCDPAPPRASSICRATACRARSAASARSAPARSSSGKAQIQGGDTFYAVIEFSKNGPPMGEALLGYGNWSRVGSKHVDDQLALASQKKMRPIMRSRVGD